MPRRQIITISMVKLVGLSFPFLTYGPWAGPACALCLGGRSRYPAKHGKRQNHSLLWGLLQRPHFPSRGIVQQDLGKGPSGSSTAVGQETSLSGLKLWLRAGGANRGEPGGAQPGLGDLAKCLQCWGADSIYVVSVTCVALSQ